MEEKSREQALSSLLKKMDIEYLYLNPNAVTDELLIEWVQKIASENQLGHEELYAQLESTNYVAVRGTLFKGIRTEYYLKEILECQEQYKMDLLARVCTSDDSSVPIHIIKAKKLSISCYKISLMPRDVNEYQQMIRDLIIGLKNDSKLQEAIASFKVQPIIDFSWPLEEIKELLEAKSADGEVMPLIVIYCANGKHYAQYALNILYGLYKDLEGLGIVPRYSKKITNSLSYTQGNGDEKSLFPQCFSPDKVFYAEDFIEHEEPFELINPAVSKN